MKTHQNTIQRVGTRLAATLTMSVMIAQGQQDPDRRNPEPNVRRPAGIPREMPSREKKRPNERPEASAEGVELPAENRSIDGSGNNAASIITFSTRASPIKGT